MPGLESKTVKQRDAQLVHGEQTPTCTTQAPTGCVCAVTR